MKADSADEPLSGGATKPSFDRLKVIGLTLNFVGAVALLSSHVPATFGAELGLSVIALGFAIQILGAFRRQRGRENAVSFQTAEQTKAEDVYSPTAKELHAQRLELETSQLAEYHKIENWGLTLSLAGIALIGQQLFEWQNAQPAKNIAKFWFATPMLAGFAAMLVLLGVNRMGRMARMRISGIIPFSAYGPLVPRGRFGWMLAVMPLVWGAFVSAFLGLPWSIALLSVVACYLAVRIWHQVSHGDV